MNDNAPEFVGFRHKIHVNEDTKIATAVARISAFDRDEGDNSRLNYELIENDKGGVFYIDRSVSCIANDEIILMCDVIILLLQSGEVILAKPLDRERVESYELQIMVKDNPESLSGSKFTNKIMKVTAFDVAHMLIMASFLPTPAKF